MAPVTGSTTQTDPPATVQQSAWTLSTPFRVAAVLSLFTLIAFFALAYFRRVQTAEAGSLLFLLSQADAGPCLPVCVPDGRGSWVGSVQPLSWHPSAASSPPRCVHAVTGIVDFLRIFGGQRFVFTGDSLTRNEIADIVNLAYNCTYFVPGPGRSSVRAPSLEWEASWTIPVPQTGSAAHAVYVSERQAACGVLQGSFGWHSSLFKLRLPEAEARPVALDFLWEAYVEMLPVRNDWFKVLAANSSTLRAIVVGAYAWAGFQFQKPGDPVYMNASGIVGAHRNLIAALANSSLRAATYFRSQPVMERGVNNASMVSTDGSLAVSDAIADAWRLHHPWSPVIDMRGFSRASACTGALALGGAAATNESGGYCLSPSLTFDGHHPQSWQSVPRMQATLDAIAAHSCRRSPSPGCDIVCA